MPMGVENSMTDPNCQQLLSSIKRDIYAYLRDWMGNQNFPVERSDKLYETYGIVDEDLDDLVVFVAKSNELKLPSDVSYWTSPVNTVDDLVSFIATFPPS
jgi:hypothetical protein